ncbi:MAG: thioredoxin domain-containing protein [Chlamydiota bacterium]
MTFTNRLIHEKSPYLLQHAHNPVEWYPWGQEAFDAAEKEQKPIFLSIGYATCHWCHVMETESFESPDVAKMMNDTFINIKVDREELPGVDSIYMEFAQALMSSAGGWPLNVILTPDLKPFFAVTYLPPKSRRGMMGLNEFVEQIKLLWLSEERAKLIEQAEKMIELFMQISKHTAGSTLPNAETLTNGIEILFDLADPIYGGIKGEPKFPLGYQVLLFLAFSRLNNESRSQFYAELTLDKMAQGGIYDQIGGGFSRYSVDEKWLIPHFEKMLYDNAILARTYLDAWRFTQKPFYAQVCEGIIQYLLREMSHSEGGFYSAQDADTEGHEGLFYTWTPNEIEEVLGKDDTLLFCRCYGVTAQGNFEGRSVLHLQIPVEELDKNLQERLVKTKELLFKKRNTRTHPFKDDKVISGWNGLAIDLLIHAAAAFHNETYKTAAINSAEFIHKNLWRDGHLLRRFRDGESKFPASLDDYAYMIKACLSLFEYGCGSKWLKWAEEMTTLLEIEFKAEKGAFYQTDPSSKLLVRKCEFYDGAEPSGNAVHAENLLRFYQITQNEDYLHQVEDILKAAEAHMTAYPPGACYHFIALQRYLDVKAPLVVIACNEACTNETEIKEALEKGFIPHLAILWKKSADKDLEGILTNHSEKIPIEGKTAVYICLQDKCLPPLTEKEEILKAIEKL